MVLTTSGRRYKHRVMEEHGISDYFEEIIDRDETYFRKEQGIYHLFRKLNRKLEVILLSGTASYLRAGNNLEFAQVAGNDLSVFTVALATEHSYNDQETLAAAKPKLMIRSLGELIPKLREAGLLPEAAGCSPRLLVSGVTPRRCGQGGFETRRHIPATGGRPPVAPTGGRVVYTVHAPGGCLCERVSNPPVRQLVWCLTNTLMKMRGHFGRRQGAMTCRGDRRSPLRGVHHARKSNAADGQKDPHLHKRICETRH